MMVDESVAVVYLKQIVDGVNVNSL
jgi:hypothetical protein